MATAAVPPVAARGNATASIVVSASRAVETAGLVGVGPKKEVSNDATILFEMGNPGAGPRWLAKARYEIAFQHWKTAAAATSVRH